MKLFSIIAGLLLTGCSFSAFAQDALTILKFEDAEKAFNTGNYEEALKHLDEVEKAAGISSKTLYLRIVIENEQFVNGENLYTDKSRFELLQRVRQNAGRYLKALSKQEIDDKYRKVYRISELLDSFPKTKQAWLTAMHAYLAKKKEEAVIQEKKRLALELAQKADEELPLYANNTLPPEQVRYNILSQLVDNNTNNYCTVYFYRKPVMSGRLVNTKIFLHNAFIFPLATKHYKKILLSPGVVKFNALHGTFKESNKNINKKIYNKSTLCFKVEAHKVYYIHTRVKDHIELTLTNKAEAAGYIQQYKEMH